MAAGTSDAATPRSIVLTTGIDVLPADRVVRRRDGYTLVRSPSNPAHYWGNLLVFDEAPADGDAGPWEELFQHEFGDEPRVRHRTFAWDKVDGALGRARDEFEPRGYDLDESIGLVAVEPVAHPRANRDVSVRALDPSGDEELWATVVELQVAGREEGHEEAGYREFSLARLAALRAHFVAGRGAWYVALDPATGAVAASCGIVVTAGRGRFQTVETAPAYQRRGIASRLVVDAAHHSIAAHRAERFVIVADAGYHAVGLYESLGFERKEHVFGVCRRPPT